MENISKIKGYHAHVYFDQDSFDQAQKLCEAAGSTFGVGIGHMHRQNVGPHPRWSCQLSVTPEQFGQVMPWLALNRNGLTVFTHPDTGEHLIDHTDRVIWLGESLALNLSIFDGIPS
jgi:aromatic ring-cleaving dioxygenase